MFSLQNLYRQYYACRRNKRQTTNARRFEVQQERFLLALQEALETRTYHPSRSVCFVATLAKLREIFAADFRDRIVHHVLVAELEKIWEPIFIHDSYACRRGKGVHRGVQRLQQFLRQATANGTRPAFFLQLDIQNYFMTIDKAILFALIAAKVKDPDVLWLAQVLIFHDCTEDYLVRGDPRLLLQVPPRKSLRFAPPHTGLPIGNLNSQFFANVYLNELDQFVKHRLKCRWYLRYCDDFVLLSRDREELLGWRDQIGTFLRERLKLALNPTRQRLQPVSNGIDWLGYIVRPDYLLVRRRVVHHLRRKIERYQMLLVKEGPGVRRYDFDQVLLARLAAMLASYLGHFKMAQTYRLCGALWKRYPFLSQYFRVISSAKALERRVQFPMKFSTVARQYGYYRWRFAGDVLLFQVGRFFEFYQARDQEVAGLLRLKPLRHHARGARYGLPVRLGNRALRRLLRLNRSVALILEREGPSLTPVKRRWPVYRFEPRS
jgi:retron-type reverse transcriptase